MKRDIYAKLIEWKTSKRRKPLLLSGARQTGKTYILKEFGANEYEKTHYFNFEEDPYLSSFFERNLEPGRIISDLSIYCKYEIRPRLDLIIFDEIQVSNKALNSLKYFQESANNFHIAAAGSLLGVKLSSPGSFPVGKVNFLKMYPLTFLEFLDAVGESKYRQLLENLVNIEPLPEAFHEDIITLLRRYYFIGGMPEAVKQYVETQHIEQIREIQLEIINSYVLDFVKHAPASDVPKLSSIWDSIPKHLARENKKFVFSAIRKGARAREYENALIWLEDAGLIYRTTVVEKGKIPLKQFENTNSFKVYSLDIGLLGAMVRILPDIIVQGNRLFDDYKGAFVENYVAQQLTSAIEQRIYYWSRKDAKAEVDFICEINGRIYPIEVKSGINPRSKSLKSYDGQFSPVFLIRTTLLNFKHDGKTINIPLYAINLIEGLLEKQMRNNELSVSKEYSVVPD